jgi:hypothetical protein
MTPAAAQVGGSQPTLRRGIGRSAAGGVLWIFVVASRCPVGCSGVPGEELIAVPMGDEPGAAERPAWCRAVGEDPQDTAQLARRNAREPPASGWRWRPGATASAEAADVVLTVDRIDALADAILVARRAAVSRGRPSRSAWGSPSPR